MLCLGRYTCWWVTKKRQCLSLLSVKCLKRWLHYIYYLELLAAWAWAVSRVLQGKEGCLLSFPLHSFKPHKAQAFLHISFLILPPHPSTSHFQHFFAARFVTFSWADFLCLLCVLDVWVWPKSSLSVGNILGPAIETDSEGKWISYRSSWSWSTGSMLICCFPNVGGWATGRAIAW